MTPQTLLDIHKPQTLEDCDALMAGNYFHDTVIREPWKYKELVLGVKYTVKKKGLWGKKQVAYISGLIQ
jgi:hypothetical protein